MRNVKLTVLLSTLLLVSFAVAVSAESRSFRCTDNGTVYSYEAPHSGPLTINLTWPKATADNDVLVFGSAGDMVGLGFSVEPRFEQLAIGALPGFFFDILAIKFDGPNSRCYLYLGSSDGGLIRASSGGRLRYRGTIEELAQTDPRYEKMWETTQRIMRAKGWDPDR